MYVRTSTSVSGDLITMQSCPLGDAWPAWSSISVSASSCFVHNSSTLLQSIPFSPSVSLWQSIPSVTQSELKSANLTKYYSGFCHSCIRKYARFALLLPSVRYFFHWVGHIWLPWLIAIWMLPPAQHRSLSGLLMDTSGYSSMIMSVLVLSWDATGVTRWKT